MDWSGPILLTVAWVLWAPIAHLLTRNPRRDPVYGLGLAILRLYARVVHRLEVRGAEHIPHPEDLGAPGGLVVMVNHTAGVDPVLVQAVCPFEIRWMMARDMMLPALAGWWAWLDIIPVNRGGDGVAGHDPTAAREALRHLAAGGVVGVFPEGGIERPPRTLRPFMPGVGLLVKRARARILPIIVEGTPPGDSAWESLLKPSRSRLTILPVVEPSASRRSADEITADLFHLYQSTTGWPARGPLPLAS